MNWENGSVLNISFLFIAIESRQDEQEAFVVDGKGVNSYTKELTNDDENRLCQKKKIPKSIEKGCARRRFNGMFRLDRIFVELLCCKKETLFDLLHAHIRRTHRLAIRHFQKYL